MAYLKFAESILKSKPIKVFNHGNMERDFTYIDDIIDGILSLITIIPPKNISEKLVDTNASFKIYNLGGNKLNNLNTFINILEKSLKKKAIKQFEPKQPGDLTVTFADITAIKETIDYEPKINLKDGLQRFVDWFLSYTPSN